MSAPSAPRANTEQDKAPLPVREVFGRDRRDSPQAWLAAVGATLAVCVVYGLAYSYGQFFKPIAETFHAGEGAGSVVFSVTSLLGFGLSVVTGPLTDRAGPRIMLIAGAACLGLGLLFTAITTSLWQAYLAYGFGVGFGLGCVYVPMLATIGQWFEHHRALATGLVVTGVGLGTFISSPLAAWLITQVGWRQAYLYYAAGGSTLLLFSAILVSRPPRPPQLGSRTDSIGKRGFGIFYAATFLVNIVIYVPYVHLSYSAQLMGIEALSAATLVSAIGISNIAGRLLIGALASRIGPLTLFKACHAGFGLCFLVWLAAQSYGGLLVFSALFGANHGAYSALIPVVVAEEFGIKHLGKVLGVLFTALGLGSAIGPPLMGYLVQSMGTYTVALSVLWIIGFSSAGLLMRYRAQP